MRGKVLTVSLNDFPSLSTRSSNSRSFASWAADGLTAALSRAVLIRADEPIQANAARPIRDEAAITSAIVASG
jgi:hypothetical protein